MKKENWFKKHPIWAGVIGVIVLFILISIFNGGDDTSINVQEDIPSNIQEEVIKFSKSITDPSEDCEGAQCKEAIDIVSASLNHESGFSEVVIELNGNIPSASELKEIKDENDLTWPEIYQYVLSVSIDGKWIDVLFGDVRADTKESAGGCGAIYIVKKDMGTCRDSQVAFSSEGNKVTISGPLKPQISDFRIKTLYESTTDISITDIAEGN